MCHGDCLDFRRLLELLARFGREFLVKYGECFFKVVRRQVGRT